MYGEWECETYADVQIAYQIKYGQHVYCLLIIEPLVVPELFALIAKS